MKGRRGRKEEEESKEGRQGWRKEERRKEAFRIFPRGRPVTDDVHC
jgi:hypothetical protein